MRLTLHIDELTKLIKHLIPEGNVVEGITATAGGKSLNIYIGEGTEIQKLFTKP